MKVTVLSGDLRTRDAELGSVSPDFFSERDLSIYEESAKVKVARQEGQYRSRQGPSISPVPFWAIEFKTIRRRTGDIHQVLPAMEGSHYLIQTARWALDVSGTGTEKEKWRGVSLSGKCSLSHSFGVVSSAWLVPYAIAHRYIVHIPAEANAKRRNGTVTVRHDFSDRPDQKGLSAWMETSDHSNDEFDIHSWTSVAQKFWEKRRTERSTALASEWLDYQGKLTNQKPNSIRVVHTRSRSFYAAVLDPNSTTATRLPYTSVKLQVVERGEPLESFLLPIAGVICDNLLHSIEVTSESEAYWMSGLFNSERFNGLVMKEARGEPPGIYTLPAKLLNNLGLTFDPRDPNHTKLAEVSKILEGRMRKTVSDYLAKEKGLVLNLIDDTDESPEVPSTISSALMRRLEAETELLQVEKLASRIMS
jgi:hypothetical protein